MFLVNQLSIYMSKCNHESVQVERGKNYSYDYRIYKLTCLICQHNTEATSAALPMWDKANMRRDMSMGKISCEHYRLDNTESFGESIKYYY